MRCQTDCHRDEESQELHEFSMGLFYQYSNIRSWLVDRGMKSGSGCWGTELYHARICPFSKYTMRLCMTQGVFGMNQNAMQDIQNVPEMACV